MTTVDPQDVWAIVPARAGSKGVLHKNVRDLGGHPLLAWSVMAGRRAATVSRVILSTDSAEYADVGVKYGAEAPFLRPAAHASDSAGDIDFMLHAINWFRETEGRLPKYWAHLRPTSPLRRADVVSDAVGAMARVPHASALRSVHEMSESAYKSFEMDDGRLKRLGSDSFDLDIANAARQSFPSTYMANGYVDIIRTDLIVEQGLMHGSNVLAFETPTITEVDTEYDLEYLQYQASRDVTFHNALFD